METIGSRSNRFVIFALSFALLCDFGAVSQDTVPNLSGVWRRNSQKSSPTNHPPDDMRVKIEQNGPDVTISLRSSNNGREEITTERLRIGSADNKNEIHGTPMTSKAAWERFALVVDSTARFGDGELRMNDRWTLAPDGQTLTFTERHQFGAEPQATEDTHVFDRQPDGSWEQTPPKPAEEVYKNIQVMKGVPAPRLMAAMMFFTKSLGVQCNYCHIPNEFEKYDKPAKNIARKMLNMVHEINGANFPDNQIVSCWMCHRGNPKPEAFPK